MGLTIIQAISAILLILGVLLQSRGSGLGRAFGDQSTIQHTRRGAEKFIYYFTIVTAIVFIISSALAIIL